MSNIEFYGEIKRETDKAYLVFDGINEIWLPKSQVKEFKPMDGLNCKNDAGKWGGPH